MKVIITSQNPVKINAVKFAFRKVFPSDDFVFESMSVSSDVSDQPMTDNETFEGAKNRVLNAKKESDADFFVGIEGGLEKIGKDISSFAWVYILSSDKEGKAKTSTFFLPAKVSKLIMEGIELGKANDIVYNDVNSKQKNGMVGRLTNNLITRTSYYVEAVILALGDLNGSCPK